MNPEEASYISNKLIDLDTFLDELDNQQQAIEKNLVLPDFAELQAKQETARVGYFVEDIETSIANIGIEISDARKNIERLRGELKKFLTDK